MNDQLTPNVLKTGSYKIVFSTKTDGNMLRTNETRIITHNNRVKFLQKNDIDPNNVFNIRTSHSPNIEIIDIVDDNILKKLYIQKPVIDTDFEHYYTGSDGVLTFNSNIFIGLISGDCIPLVIWDNVSGVHGILHIGLLGVLNNMVNILPRVFSENNIQLKDTNYYIGPSISQENYDISSSGLWTAISNQAYKKIENIAKYIKRENNIDYFDIQKMLNDQLIKIGVMQNQIQKYRYCIADENSIFFSHNILKRQGQNGNFFSVIGLSKHNLS